MSDAQGPQRPVTEAINMVLGEWPAEGRGFIIVLPAKHAGPTGFARVYSGHDRPSSWEGGVRIFSAQVEQAERWHMFDTYQEAYEAAHWVAKAWGPADTIDKVRIAEVIRRPPVELLGDRPVSVLDALAEVVDG